jgi:hypothetical protein
MHILGINNKASDTTHRLYSWLQVDEDGTRHVLAGSSLAEEGVERVIASSNGLAARHLTVRLDTVLQTVQFPAGIAHLDSGLADMDADALKLQFKTLLNVFLT